MKLALTHALVLAGSLATASADPTQAPTTPAPTTFAVENALLPLDANSTMSAAGNSTGHGIGILETCRRPNEGLAAWWYNSYSEGPYFCTKNHDSHPWTMYNAYRSGGTEGVHWKYTNDPNDSDCLTNWKYYGSDGNSLIASGIARTTFQGDSRRWCAMAVYRTGGVFNKQWGYCECW